MAKNNKETNNINNAASEAVKVISDAAGKATQAIADAALSATKLLATNAAEAAKITNVKGSDDHDLLVELKVKMEGLKSDISDIKDGTATKIADHELRINKLETSNTRQTTMLGIGIAILSLLVSLLVYHLFQA